MRFSGPLSENGGKAAVLGNGGGTLRTGSKRLHLRGQAALVPRGLVLVDDALARDAVERGRLGTQGRVRARLVAGDDGLLDLLDRGAQRRAQTHVRGALVERLLGAFRGLL